jgi:cytochrome d ubiquinol oxidase subunit I
VDVLILSRVQFAATIAFHYIFPPLSIGLGLILVIMEGLYLKTRDPLFHRMTRFWVRIFGLIFAIGVASGIVMEFQFGTNWSRYSRFVGDIFGSALAAEGIFAFFLESGFLAVLLFGWNKVSPRMHFISTIAVAFGAHLSAVWILVANSWQQTPAGYHIVQTATGPRAELTDFWAAVFNPSTLDRLSHTLMGAWQAGAFLVLSVSAYYLLKRRHIDFAKASMKIALSVALIASLASLVTGHGSAQGVAKNQPTKLAAFEGQWKTGPGELKLFGWVDEQAQKTYGVGIPGMTSFLVHGDFNKPLAGLDQVAPKDRPPVNLVFQSYHTMVAIGFGLIGLTFAGLFFWWRGTLWDHRWLLRLFVLGVLLPQAANQLGWVSAEVGRQPWIVYGMLRTERAFSPNVSAGEVLTSLILFGLIYALLFVLFVFLLDRKIKHGPVFDDDAGSADAGVAAAVTTQEGRA